MLTFSLKFLAARITPNINDAFRRTSHRCGINIISLYDGKCYLLVNEHQVSIILFLIVVVVALAGKIQRNCALFEGEYDGQVNFVPEDTSCGLGTKIVVRVDEFSCDKTKEKHACCLDVLVDCYGLGNDDDLIPFLVSCPKISGNGPKGAIAFECPTTVKTTDVWKIDDDKLVVLGRLDDSDGNQFGFITGTRRVK
ncbi:hypothetical protein ACA910_005160 [Epithemia clementina (nom. ined.)]